MFLKTNILRIQTQGKCYSYQCHFNNQLTQQDILQIQSYIENLDNNLIYSHPMLYANQPINVTQLEILLSKGESVLVKFQLIKSIDKKQILGDICQKILRSFQFLCHRKSKLYFNPFQQANDMIPGIYFEPVYELNYVGIAFLPINLVIEPPVEISSAKILIDYSKGKFYQPNDTVKVDKINNIFQFRNGEKVSISNLRKGKISNVSGLLLAQRLKNYLARARENCKQFLQNWSIKIENSFLSLNTFLISVGAIEFRDKKQKSLSELVFPIARNSFNHSFRQLFKSNSFEASLQAELVFIFPNFLSKIGKQILHQYQKLSERMNMKLKLSTLMLNNLDSKQQITQMATSAFLNKLAIYILVVPKQLTAAQSESIEHFKGQMINSEYYFHIIPFDKEQQVDEIDILALRHLAIIYCKMRLIPWKLKNLPFNDKPTIVCNLNVQQTSQGQYSIAIVSSMNLYFSKFCCFHAFCNPDKLENTIYTLLQNCLNKFMSIHNTYPFRVFLFRTGHSLEIQQQYKTVKSRFSSFFTSINSKNTHTLSYVHIKKSHPIRTYIQTDQNFISRHTVKKTQLLACTVIEKRFYIQLEFDQPPIELQLYENQNDPGFMQKVLQLTARLSFGSVGNEFGKGTGFLSFAQKLNAYKQFDLSRWKKHLEEGVMLFL